MAILKVKNGGQWVDIPSIIGPPGPEGSSGISPAVTINDITDGHRVTITDATGPHSFDVLNGVAGQTGPAGTDGVTFTPSVDSNGVISWINDGGLPNPEPRNIMGPPGTGIDVHICAIGEYSTETRKPTILSPATNTFYLVPAENAASPDMFVEWIFADGDWEMFGSATVDVPVQDVQVNGVSVLSNGVANVPLASNDGDPGVVKLTTGANGIVMDNNGFIYLASPTEAHLRQGNNVYRALKPSIQHISTFYGLAKAAGDTTQSASSNAVGDYTESAKSAISTMLNSPITVSGTTPSITALPGIQYVCGEVATLDITLPASGCVDVVFVSGSTPTVLTVTPPNGVTVKWTNGFDPTALEANTTYEINIKDGLGVAASWT